MAERLRAEPLLPTGEAKAGKAFGLTGRSLLIAFAFVLLFAYITPYNDYDLANTFVAGNLLPTSSMVVLLLCVFIVNPFLRRFARRFALRTEELAAIWAIIVIASGIPQQVCGATSSRNFPTCSIALRLLTAGTNC